MTTLKKVVNKALMRVLVSDQQLAVIERDGKIKRLAGPGYISYNRFSEEIARFVNIGPQEPVTIDLLQIRSFDGYLVDIRCKIPWGFDPRRCNFKQSPHLVRKAPEFQMGLITGVGARVIRDIVGSMTAAQLRLGQTPAEIEFQLKSRLYHKICFAGIILLPPAVEQLTPPATLDKTIREAQEKRIRLENKHFEKQEQARIVAATKRVETEAEADLRSIQAKTEATVKRTIAAAEVHQRSLMTDVTVREQELLMKIAATQMELTYKWLASLPPDLVKQITDTEAFRMLAANSASLHLFAPLPGPWPASMMPMLAPPQQLKTNGYHNGKDF
jgi:regulator of protease activity HflC (stomatin/prohibitin superfamily)